MTPHHEPLFVTVQRSVIDDREGPITVVPRFNCVIISAMKVRDSVLKSSAVSELWSNGVMFFLERGSLMVGKFRDSNLRLRELFFLLATKQQRSWH